MALDIDTVFRDHVVKGDIHSGANDPDKAEIRSLLKALTGGASSPSIVKQTKAALDLVTPASENFGGLVLNDPDATKNGYYYRDSSAWVKGRGFPDTFAVLSSIGGTANAITASTEAGVDPADVLCVLLSDPPGTNSSSSVTLAINGGAATAVRAASGANIAVGDIIEGVGTLFFKGGSEWRQLFSSATGATFDHQGDYAGGTTFTEGQVVTGSDGKWYQLKDPSATGDDPVGSVTGAWLQILAAAAVADGAVTTVKLADQAVTDAKVADSFKAKVVGIAADRTALSAMDGTKYLAVDLMESGRKGLFYWNGGDLSAMVTADPQQGVYVPLATDSDGSSGAWVRQFDGDLHANWFGLSEVGTGAANVTAVNAAIHLGFVLEKGVALPAGEFDIAVTGSPNGIRVKSGTHLYGKGKGRTILMLQGASTQAELVAQSNGFGIGRTYTPGVANVAIGSVLVEKLAVVMNHPGTGAISTNHVQIAFDFRNISRSYIRDCWAGNYHPVSDTKGFTRPYLCQGYGVVFGNVSASDPGYCGGEVNTVEDCFIVGFLRGVTVDDTILSPISAAYKTAVRNNDIQIGLYILTQGSQYGAGNVFENNILQATQKPAGSSDQCYVLIVAGYGNFIREPYIEAGNDCQYMCYLLPSSHSNRIEFSATCSVGGGLIGAIVDDGTAPSKNYVEFFLNTGGSGTYAAGGAPARLVSNNLTTIT